MKKKKINFKFDCRFAWIFSRPSFGLYYIALNERELSGSIYVSRFGWVGGVVRVAFIRDK